MGQLISLSFFLNLKISPKADGTGSFGDFWFKENHGILCSKLPLKVKLITLRKLRRFLVCVLGKKTCLTSPKILSFIIWLTDTLNRVHFNNFSLLLNSKTDSPIQRKNMLRRRRGMNAIMIYQCILMKWRVILISLYNIAKFRLISLLDARFTFGDDILPGKVLLFLLHSCVVLKHKWSGRKTSIYFFSRFIKNCQTSDTMSSSDHSRTDYSSN